jgi:hypothetical protein
MKIWERIARKVSKRPEIVVVSGLPRSGTSMMMKMLEAGGIPPLTDHQRAADEDNPKGYYEFERVKKLKEGDYAWLEQVEGRAVKVISALLEHLPGDYRYRVLFMKRAMPEILASQKEMLIRRGEDPKSVPDEEMAGLFTQHLAKLENWLEGQKNITVLYLNYNTLLEDPEPYVHQINAFLGDGLDTAQMSAVVDPKLYRQRG